MGFWLELDWLMDFLILDESINRPGTLSVGLSLSCCICIYIIIISCYLPTYLPTLPTYPYTSSIIYGVLYQLEGKETEWELKMDNEITERRIANLCMWTGWGRVGVATVKT